MLRGTEYQIQYRYPCVFQYIPVVWNTYHVTFIYVTREARGCSLHFSTETRGPDKQRRKTMASMPAGKRSIQMAATLPAGRRSWIGTHLLPTGAALPAVMGFTPALPDRRFHRGLASRGYIIDRGEAAYLGEHPASLPSTRKRPVPPLYDASGGGMTPDSTSNGLIGGLETGRTTSRETDRSEDMPSSPRVHLSITLLQTRPFGSRSHQPVGGRMQETFRSRSSQRTSVERSCSPRTGPARMPEKRLYRPSSQTRRSPPSEGGTTPAGMCSGRPLRHSRYRDGTSIVQQGMHGVWERPTPMADLSLFA